MATTLHMEAFGRFDRNEIPLAQTTWIIGGHDSGKTTVYDAIAAGLGGAIDPRYGDGARAWFDGALPQARHHELHLIPARGAPSALGRSMREQVAVSVSPLHRVAERLAELLCDERSDRDTEPLQAELNRQRERVEELWRRHDAAVAGHRDLRRLATLEAQLHRAREAVADIGACIEVPKQRARLGERLALLRQQLRDIDALDETTDASPPELAELESLQGEVDAHRTQIAAIEIRQARCRQRLRQVAADIDEDDRRIPALRRTAHRATAMRLRLEQFRAEHTAPERQVWRPSRVAAAGAFFLAGAASAVLLGGLEHFVGLGLGMTLGTCTLAWGRRTIPGDRLPAETAFVTQLRDEWNNEAGLPPLEANDGAAVIEYCRDAVSAHEQAEAALNDRVSYQRRVELETAQILERSHAMLHHTLPSREHALAQWLQLHGVHSSKEYHERISRREALKATIDDRRRRADLPARREAIAQLEAQVAAELDILAQQPTHTDAEIDGLVENHAHLLDRCAELERECETLRERNGDAPEDLGPLARELFDLELEEQRMERAMVKLDAERRAIAAAAEQVAEWSADATLPWRLLDETLAELLDAAGLDRQVQIDDTNADRVTVTDSRGTARRLADLGDGSRRLLALACHLAAVAQFDDGPRLLAIDEPCAGLSEQYAGHALALLAAFQERCGWQLVLTSRTAPAGPFAAARVVDLDEWHSGAP
jgi:prefoldin subunit 5